MLEGKTLLKHTPTKEGKRSDTDSRFGEICDKTTLGLLVGVIFLLAC